MFSLVFYKEDIKLEEVQRKKKWEGKIERMFADAFSV